MLTKLVIAVNDIESATSPSANLVNTFEVTPPGAAAINITPSANSTGTFKIMINRYAIIGRMINWQINPTIISFGFWNTLVKSLTVKEAPRPSIIKANAIGAIEVTICIYDISVIYIHIIIKEVQVYEINKRLSVFLKNLDLSLKNFFW